MLGCFSTLMKVISGALQPDEGQIFRSPPDAVVATLQQEVPAGLTGTVQTVVEGEGGSYEEHNDWERHDRVERYDELARTLAEVFAEREREYWLPRLEAHDVPFTPERTLDELDEDPQVRHLGVFYTQQHPRHGTLRAAHRAIRYDGDHDSNFLPPPDLGKETGELTARIAWYVTDDRMPLREIYGKQSEATLTQQAEFSSKTGEMIKEARSYGIRPITIGRLLAYLGYEMGAPVIGRAESVNTRALQRLTEKRSGTGEEEKAKTNTQDDDDDLMNAPRFP